MKIIISVMLSVVALLNAQSSKSPNSSEKSGKDSSGKPTTPSESPEHTVARSEYESVTRQYEESKAEYNKKIATDLRCQVFPELIRHPISSSSVDNYTVGCAYETKKARYVMDKIAEYVEQYEIQLRDVDKCLAVYRTTIDKKISDQTTREVEEIKTCQAEHLYPPRTK